MKLVLQRVKSASVVDSATSQVCGQIGSGLFVLVGIDKEDNLQIAEKAASKILKIRLMQDDLGKMNLSVIETKKSILLVSQFTLISDSKSGNRPSFVRAMDFDSAYLIYDHLYKKLQESSLNVQRGCFGKYMKINLELDGPVTIGCEI